MFQPRTTHSVHCYRQISACNSWVVHQKDTKQKLSALSIFSFQVYNFTFQLNIKPRNVKLMVYARWNVKASLNYFIKCVVPNKTLLHQ